MSDELQYKMVDGVLVPLTPEEIATINADREQQRQQQTLSTSNNNLDMGKTMFQILNE